MDSRVQNQSTKELYNTGEGNIWSLHYISTSYLIGFIVINPTGISTLYLYFISHQIYCNYSDRDLYTTSLLLISSILLSSIRQGSLHYISTSYLIDFIVIIPTGISTLYLYTSYLISFIVISPTGISTLYLYFLSHQFYCHQSDRNLYTISLLLISLVLLSLFRQESQHYISTSYLIGFIVINPTGISTLYLYLLSYRFYHHVSHHISSELSSSHITCLVVY